MPKGKTALVTGSTSGIGLAVARALAAQGAHVMLNGFGAPEEIEKQRKSLESEFGIQTAWSGADLTKPDQIELLIEDTLSQIGGIDILVNNAGIQYVAPIEEFPPEKWEKIIALNLSAVYYGIHYALPYMKKKNHGRIINIASAHGLVASPGKSAYVAAKHGVIGLTKVVALETARTGITCNAICPGWVLTPLVQKQIDAIAEKEGIPEPEARLKLLSEKQPSLEFVRPEQIGDLACFLCSDSAAQITGSAYSIDGGWTAQ